MEKPAGLSEIKEWERVSAHSHVKGLGLEKGKPVEGKDGMIGQGEAREAAGIITELVRDGKFAGRAVLIAGPPGTGKTAIALGMAKGLGKDVPFVPLTASEIYSSEMKKTEFLTKALRKAIGVRVREMRKIYEGVVEKIDVEMKSHPLNPYQKVPGSARITLRTSDEKKSFSVDQSFAMQFMKQGLEEGDVVQIDIDGNQVSKLGRSEETETADLSSEQKVPVPDGEVFKEREFVFTLTLDQMDVANSRRGDIFSLMFGASSQEVDSELRRSIDETVRKWVETGKAEILPGVVFIDECSMLDIESFAFLNRAMESDLAPIIVFATNRGLTKIKGTGIESPHGMPLDLLDRLLIISTRPYEKGEIGKILKIRAEAEKLKVEKTALKRLTEIGGETSLRYSVQLLAPAAELADGKINKGHVEEANKLFSDVKRSVKYLKEYEKKMLE